jgi:hypothetical protein
MQESFRGVDASIAGHISKVSQFTKSKSHQSYRTPHDIDSDVDIKSNSLFWSDEEEANQYNNENRKRKLIPHQRKISRYLSTVNRSLLDHPSDLIADFYLSQLNRNMQESVRHIEIISRDKAYKQEFIDYRENRLGRSLSAEHLYQVRKEHLRYKQPSTKPTSFTAEDVADIYKRFVLENYKRKIAIELERRRRARQGQFIPGITSSPIYTSETDSNRHIIKSFHRPRTHNNFLMVSPPIIVQTKEIIMGRARRTLTNDGSSDVIHHISGVSPPPIYSVNKRSSSQARIRFTATINEPYDSSYITAIDPLDFVDRNRQDGMIITQHHPQTKIYTHTYQTSPIEICHANRIDSESDNLSIANVESFITLNQHEINSLIDQSYDGQIIQYTEQKPKYERSTLIIPVDKHTPIVQEDIPIIESLQTTNLSIPSINKANQIATDTEISLNISQINQQPTIFDSSFPNKTEVIFFFE